MNFESVDKPEVTRKSETRKIQVYSASSDKHVLVFAYTGTNEKILFKKNYTEKEFIVISKAKSIMSLLVRRNYRTNQKEQKTLMIMQP